MVWLPTKLIYYEKFKITCCSLDGSTLNQIAEKIKTKKIAKKVIGLAVVGSFKGFDVITDI
ncbi:MAG: hypothetical protein COB15_04765 [Flavobacteriales bacterium]|nr:MAG: hypothetical protein COB15_04765 [Flavobacteriales bacterium]